MPLLGRLPREAPGPSRGTEGSEPPPEDAPGPSEASDPRV